MIVTRVSDPGAAPEALGLLEAAGQIQVEAWWEAAVKLKGLVVAPSTFEGEGYSVRVSESANGWTQIQIRSSEDENWWVVIDLQESKGRKELRILADRGVRKFPKTRVPLVLARPPKRPLLVFVGAKYAEEWFATRPARMNYRLPLLPLVLEILNDIDNQLQDAWDAEFPEMT